MRGPLSTLAGVFTLVLLLLAPRPTFANDMKEWTFMVFLNGNNNLDSFGAVNINQLETVGSTKDINVVVQWASYAAATTKRLYVTKDEDTSKVTSQVVEDLPRVDMGDYRKLVEFVDWTIKRYPAKHYFISLWDHGSGWHRRGATVTRDINWDDYSGNSMTTAQLGVAMQEAARLIGHKVDIMGSDACLMAMVEVNEEVSDFVEATVASEELEPGLGWPYDKLIQRWAAAPTATAHDVTKILTEEYLKLYLPGGAGFGLGDVTLSSANLTFSTKLNASLKGLGESIRKLSTADLAKVRAAVVAAQKFSSSDYVDLGDFLTHLGNAKIPTLQRDALADVKDAYREYVNSNHTTSKYTRATGASFWFPTSRSLYDAYSAKYKALKFASRTGWDAALEWVLN